MNQKCNIFETLVGFVGAMALTMKPVLAEGRRTYDLSFRAQIPSLCIVGINSNDHRLSEDIIDRKSVGTIKVGQALKIACNVPYAVDVHRSQASVRRGVLTPVASLNTGEITINFKSATVSGAVVTACSGASLLDAQSPCSLAGGVDDSNERLPSSPATIEMTWPRIAIVPSSQRGKAPPRNDADVFTVSFLPRW